MSKTVKGFKVFNGDWSCLNFRFEVGKTYTHEGELRICNSGFHFCEKAIDCFDYYNFNPNNKVAEVIAHGGIQVEGNKSCTDKIEIVREVSWPELLDLVNTGKGNSGKGNSGDRNSGDWNSGHRNSGDWNSGHRNSGHRNSGDWNSGDRNSGCFNTDQPKMRFFNKDSDWTYEKWRWSDARYILQNMPFDRIDWVETSVMLDEEKDANKAHETIGGFLRKTKVTREDKQKWWDGLKESEKDAVKALPNFDARIFEEITGIKV